MADIQNNVAIFILMGKTRANISFEEPVCAFLVVLDLIARFLAAFRGQMLFAENLALLAL